MSPAETMPIVGFAVEEDEDPCVAMIICQSSSLVRSAMEPPVQHLDKVTAPPPPLSKRLAKLCVSQLRRCLIGRARILRSSVLSTFQRAQFVRYFTFAQELLLSYGPSLHRTSETGVLDLPETAAAHGQAGKEVGLEAVRF
jgi:hypothetical protein